MNRGKGPAKPVLSVGRMLLLVLALAVTAFAATACGPQSGSPGSGASSSTTPGY